MGKHYPIKKGLVVAVIFLFAGMNVIPSIGTTVVNNSSMTTFYDGSLSGYVNNTLMNPIEGARVRVYFHGTYEEDYTDSSGYYHVTNIPICWCYKNCTASKEGYETEWVWLSIYENTTYNFVLTPLTQYDGSLSGYVNNTLMNPIEGARVRVHFHGTYEEDYTDSSGYYRVTNIPICYCLKNTTASKVGYETEWILLSITENTTHDFVLTSLDPVPDLDCNGCLCWTEVEPGAIVTGSFTVENIGDPESLLDWEIESYPDWGTWTFDPDSGTGLKPEDGPVTIEVEVIWPEETNGGEIKIVNCENPDDFCTINICVPPPPPPPQPLTFIGTIKDLEVHNESLNFHANIVFIFFLVIPVDILVNENITITNNYKGFIGSRFIFARFFFNDRLDNIITI